jgi:2-deoxy-D-gluconate 3-dehydrogenase
VPEFSLSEILRLDGKSAIVTGGAKGIGRGIAERLVEAGARVVISDIDEAAGKSAAQALGAQFVRADMASEEDLRNLIGHTIQSHGRVDILVNNAGIYPFKPVLEMTASEWDRVQAVNLRGLFLLSREFVKAAAERGQGGAIVNIGSIDSFHPSSVGLAAYDASKGGVLMFTRNFALEAAHLGIRVNMIAPGGITTEGVSAAQGGDMPEDVARDFLARVPLGRWGEPDDIATMTLVLVTPLSAYVTGAAFVVDGGRLLS